MAISYYLRPILDPAYRDQTLRDLRLVMKSCFPGAAIAVRGLSGIACGAPVAAKLGRKLVIVRKHGDSAHADVRVECPDGVKRFVVLDDLIASGDTLNAILEDIAEAIPEATCVGIVLYGSRGHHEAAGVALINTYKGPGEQVMVPVVGLCPA